MKYMQFLSIIAGIFITLTGMFITVQSITYGKTSSKPPKWIVVYDTNGTFSYVDYTGTVSEEAFASRIEAEFAMAKRKQWSDDYDADRARRDPEGSFRKNRNATYKPCP